tara:strand:+ start:3077 stop:3772 length:696 start_codon:yes stop_codon:yes gene_type:complete
MDLLTFKSKYSLIKAKGFIKSHRDGDTGVGHTFEQELGLQENNIAGPDIEGNELKTARRGKGGKQTLLNKEGEWLVSQRDYIKTYGFQHTKYVDEKSAQFTITLKPNKHGLYIKTTDEHVAVMHGDTIIVKWSWDVVISEFANKFPACIKVIADVKKQDGVEYFHYNEAHRYVNGDKNKVRTAIENGHVIIETRMYSKGIQKNGEIGIRNRGTAFRVNHGKMEELFTKEEI